jgi:hypothetical protein
MSIDFLEAKQAKDQVKNLRGFELCCGYYGSIKFVETYNVLLKGLGVASEYIFITLGITCTDLVVIKCPFAVLTT